MGSATVYRASPRPPTCSSGRLKLRLPLKRLILSKPLSAYDPAGAPGARPSGVEPSVELFCALALLRISASRKSIPDKRDRAPKKSLRAMVATSVINILQLDGEATPSCIEPLC